MGLSENDSLYSASSPSVQVDGGGELGGPSQDEGDVHEDDDDEEEQDYDTVMKRMLITLETWSGENVMD